LGISVYHADDEARNQLHRTIISKKIQNIFGVEILGENEEIDRKALSRIVFNDRNALEKLNAIIHPEVHAHFIQWLKGHQNEKYILHEAAILFESGFYKMFDKVILVVAPFELRIRRVMKRDKVSKEEVMKRIRNQWEDQKKIELADLLIHNNEDQLVIPQVISTHEKLIRIAQEM